MGQRGFKGLQIQSYAICYASVCFCFCFFFQKIYQRVYDNADEHVAAKREVLPSGGNLIGVPTEEIKSGKTDAENGEMDNGDSREGGVTKQHENCSGIRSVHESDTKVDGTSDEDLLTAMDLLCFAWQITRGMVRA